MKRKPLAHEVSFTHIKGVDLRKLSKLLKDRRETFGISQCELGRRSGVNSCVISNYEMNKTNLSRKTFDNVCKALLLDATGTLDFCRIKIEAPESQEQVTLRRVEQSKIDFPVLDEKAAHEKKLDDAIKFLKEEGYKLLIPIVDYREI